MINRPWEKAASLKQRKGPLSSRECRFRGRMHERKKELCPAWNKDCNKCGKKNHFAICCKDMAAKQIVVAAEDKHVYMVPKKSNEKKTKPVKICGTGRTLTFHIDTGADVNVIPFRDYVRVTQDKRRSKLTPSNVTLIVYGGDTF
jgi:hypothetical protein